MRADRREMESCIISIFVPLHFANCNVQELVKDNLFTASSNKLRLLIDKLDAGRAFVITRLYSYIRLKVLDRSDK